MQELIDETQSPACRKYTLLVKEGVNFTILPQRNQPAAYILSLTELLWYNFASKCSHGLLQFLENNQRLTMSQHVLK